MRECGNIQLLLVFIINLFFFFFFLFSSSSFFEKGVFTLYVLHVCYCLIKSNVFCLFFVCGGFVGFHQFRNKSPIQCSHSVDLCWERIEKMQLNELPRKKLETRPVGRRSIIIFSDVFKP